MQDARFQNLLNIECASYSKLQLDHQKTLEPNDCSDDSFVGGLIVQEANYVWLIRLDCDPITDYFPLLFSMIWALNIAVNR